MKAETQLCIAFEVMQAGDPIEPNKELKNVLDRIARNQKWYVQSVNHDNTIDLRCISGKEKFGVPVGAVHWSSTPVRLNQVKRILKSIPTLAALEKDADLNNGTLGRFLRGLRLLSQEELKTLVPVLRERGYKL